MLDKCGAKFRVLYLILTGTVVAWRKTIRLVTRGVVGYEFPDYLRELAGILTAKCI